MDNYGRNGKWRTASGLAFWGSTIQAIFNLIGLTLVMYLSYNVVDILMSGILPSVASMSLDYYEDRFAGFIGGAMICFVIGFLGYLLYMAGICLFTGAQRSENSKVKTRNVMLAELIGPVLTILFYVAFYCSPEILGLILEHYIATPIVLCALYLAAVIIPMVEFKALTKEDTWSEKAQKGADDLKFSYSCILWSLVAIVLALGIAALVVYSTYTKLKYGSFIGTDKYGYPIQGITSAAQEIQNLVSTIKVIMMFASIFVFIFSLLYTCYRISGWRKIQMGGNEEVYQFASRHAVGEKQQADASYETSAVKEEAAPATPAISTEEEPTYEEYEDEDADKRKKWLLWGGIAAGIILIAGLLWALYGRSGKIEPNANVFVDRAQVFSSKETTNDDAFIAELIYGTPVEDITDTKEDDIWTEIKFDQDGKELKGFINKHHLMNHEEFVILDESGFHEENVRDQIKERMQRIAILEAAKSLDGEWTIEILDDADTYANAKYVLIRNASPSEQCFAFAMAKKDGEDERKAFVFSTPEIFEEGNNGTPSFLYSEDVPIDKSTILDVTYNKRKKQYEISYLIGYGYCGEDESEEDEQASYVVESITIYGGPIELQGQIDGKYDISMTLYEKYDYSLSGWYKYVKNDIPIDLTGSFTETLDGIQHFNLEEFTDGKKTGSFQGDFDGTTFRGKWISQDGERELPFRVSKSE